MSAYKVKVITLFPEIFPGVLGIGNIGRSLKNKIWSLKTINPRKFAKGIHKSVDGTTAGGGPGMILKPEMLSKAISESYKGIKNKSDYPLLYLSPRGKRISQKQVQNFSKKKGVIMICGRYEGIDQRVLDYHNIEEVSIGDFILAGGEVASQAVIESIIRLLPGTLGDDSSKDLESFSNSLLEYPQYTRPKKWKNIEIPEVLLSGHHKKITKWRLEMAEKITKKNRPDLWKNYKKNKTLLK